MESGIIDPVVFFPVTAGLQVILLGRVCYLAVANGVRLRTMGRKAAAKYSAVMKFQVAATAEEQLIAKLVCQRRLQMARLYLGLLCGCLGICLLGVQLQILFGTQERWMPAPMVWSVVVGFAVTLLHVLLPTLLTVTKLNGVYVALMLAGMLGLSPLLMPSDQVFLMSISFLGFVRVPAVCIATQPALVAVCSFGPFAVVLLRATLEGGPLATPAITAEIAGFFVTLVSAVSLQA